MIFTTKSLFREEIISANDLFFDISSRCCIGSNNFITLKSVFSSPPISFSSRSFPLYPYYSQVGLFLSTLQKFFTTYIFFSLSSHSSLAYFSLHLSNYLNIQLIIYLFIHLSIIYLIIYPFVYLFIYLSIYPSIYLIIDLFIYFFIHLSIYLSIYFSNYQIRQIHS